MQQKMQLFTDSPFPSLQVAVVEKRIFEAKTAVLHMSLMALCLIIASITCNNNHLQNSRVGFQYFCKIVQKTIMNILEMLNVFQHFLKKWEKSHLHLSTTITQHKVSPDLNRTQRNMAVSVKSMVSSCLTM